MLDKIDQKLLVALLQNSRQSITQLAKTAGVSRDVANYRINRLHSTGVIRDFTTEIDVAKLGHISALFFVTIQASVEKEFIAHIHNLDYTSWAGTLLGKWSVGMAIYGRDITEIEERFQTIYSKFEKHITGHEFAFYKSTQFFYEKCFGATKKKNFAAKEDHTLDDIDKTILQSLSKNSRITCVELMNTVPLTAPAIASRIKRLERSGHILKYTVYLNEFVMGFYQFIFFIKNKNLEQRKKLYSYLEQHPKVSMLLDYVGDPFIEFGVFVEDPYETRAVLQEILESFPDNEVIDFFLAQENLLSFGLPKSVFN